MGDINRTTYTYQSCKILCSSKTFSCYCTPDLIRKVYKLLFVVMSLQIVCNLANSKIIYQNQIDPWICFIIYVSITQQNFELRYVTGMNVGKKMDRDRFWQRNEHYQDNYVTLLHATPITHIQRMLKIYALNTGSQKMQRK